jgi:hypothetical protein
MKDETLAPSSGRWKNSGTGGPIGRWTLSFSECPSAVVESSLSDVLQTSPVPPQFFLSEKACAGFLRRSEEKMDPMLVWAMKFDVSSAE